MNDSVKKMGALVVAGLLAAAGAGPAQASGLPFDALAVYGGQGADHNLKGIPKLAFGGDVKWEDSYFTSVGLSQERGSLGQAWPVLQATPLNAVRQGYELVLTQHRGLQHHIEAGATAKLTTPDVFIGPLGVNFAAGFGLSHAFGTPGYEDGPLKDPSRRYRTQLLILLDLEWRLRGIDQLSFITRVHHRSGAYGLIAPRHVGSNFLAAGLRYKF